MILVFCQKINNRVQYILKTLLQDICGFNYQATQSTEQFLNYKGAKVNYSDKNLPGACLMVRPTDFLFQKGVKDFTPAFSSDGEYPVLFPNNDEKKPCDMGFDIFASSFYQLSRYEEYLPFLEDRHGRFEADQSFAYQKGFLELPLVDLHATWLTQGLLEKFPFLKKPVKKFTFIPTYDIDVAFAYKGKGLARHVALYLSDLATFNFKRIRERTRVHLDKIPDPYDTYPFQLYLQKIYKMEPIYFFHCGKFGPKDRNVSVHSRLYQTLIKTLGDYAQTGVHPSYASHKSIAQLQEEILFLSSILNKPITKSRQHYLKFQLPTTYQNLIKSEITSDYSMGYASHTGFRAGTCSPFNFYDLSMEAETRLRIYPITMMDGTLKDYMKLKPEEAIENAKKLTDIVRAVNGTLISLWHNDSISDQGFWKGWRKVYLELLNYVHRKQPE